VHEFHFGLVSGDDDRAFARDDHDLPAAARVIGAGEHRERSLAVGNRTALLRRRPNPGKQHSQCERDPDAHLPSILDR
jgi:hypothetical protein